jgi:hypothetical protein
LLSWITFLDFLPIFVAGPDANRAAPARDADRSASRAVFQPQREATRHHGIVLRPCGKIGTDFFRSQILSWADCVVHTIMLYDPGRVCCPAYREAFSSRRTEWWRPTLRTGAHHLQFARPTRAIVSMYSLIALKKHVFPDGNSWT